MKNSSSNFMRINSQEENRKHFSMKDIETSSAITNQYLSHLPSSFGTTSHIFYSTLNQRNLSGFIGEVFKHALCSQSKRLIPNPHPDGRPDILNISNPRIEAHFKSCFDKLTGAPKRDKLAPFKYGGIEIKCTIGNISNASEFDIGVSRVESISGINFWAHHAHKCDLLGIYYDYCEKMYGAPQIKGAIFCEIEESDWSKVSIGRPDRKKTSNTSLNKQGREKLKNSLIMLSTEEKYKKKFLQLGYL